MNPLAFLIGSVTVRFRSPRPERLINAARKMNLPFRRLLVSEKEASFEILLPRRKHLDAFRETLSAAEDLTLTEQGLPALAKRYRNRWGFFAGVAFFFATTVLANFFLWGIKISGVDDDPEEILAALSDAGLAPGIWSGGLDTDEISRRFLVAHPEYSYAGICQTGMIVSVDLAHAEPVEQSESYAGYANLVASASGIVVRREVMAGECLVQPGDVVQRGDLLISGIRRTENGTFLPVHARGFIYCETSEVYETFVPFRKEREVYTGREEKHVSAFLLGRCFFSTGNGCGFSDYEEQIFWEPVRFFGRETPVYLETRVFSEKARKMTVVDVDRAKDLAYDEYIIYKAKLLERGGEFRDEECLWEEREDGVALCVKIHAVRDLCTEKAFTVVPDQ